MQENQETSVLLQQHEGMALHCILQAVLENCLWDNYER